MIKKQPETTYCFWVQRLYSEFQATRGKNDK